MTSADFVTSSNGPSNECCDFGQVLETCSVSCLRIATIRVPYCHITSKGVWSLATMDDPSLQGVVPIACRQEIRRNCDLRLPQLQLLA
jgi:hypothetical protein